MPKAKKVSKCKKAHVVDVKETLPGSSIDRDLKVENDTETELAGSSGVQFQPVHIVHFDELNRIWPEDRRIPSAKSRRAWALARNLNPTNVHSWWYRRKKVAKKLRIKIPRDIYELDVGTPPEIPIVNVKEEVVIVPNSVMDSNLKLTVNKTKDLELIPSSDAHIPLPKMDSTDFSTSDSSSMTLCIPLDHADRSFKDREEFKTDAYMHPSSPIHAGLSSSPFNPVNAPISRESSPLPPSSPPARSRSPSLLFLSSADLSDSRLTQEDFPMLSNETSKGEQYTNARADRDALWASFTLLEDFYPADLLPIKFFGIPLSSCASTSVLKIGKLECFGDISLPLDDPPLYEELALEDAPWCMDGFRISYDGSLVGLCSCCSPNSLLYMPSR